MVQEPVDYTLEYAEFKKLTVIPKPKGNLERESRIMSDLNNHKGTSLLRLLISIKRYELDITEGIALNGHLGLDTVVNTMPDTRGIVHSIWISLVVRDALKSTISFPTADHDGDTAKQQRKRIYYAVHQW